jgi:hypothetical protein
MFIVARCNSKEEIIKYLKIGFKMEVYLWCIKNSDWICGHFNPSFHLEEDFIDLNKDNIWFKCCTLHAYEYCRKLNLICYFTDHVSNGMNLSYREKSYKNVAILKDSKLMGAITSFPLLYQISLNDEKLWKQGKKLDVVYTSLQLHQCCLKYEAFPDIDPRRCIAIFSDFLPNDDSESLFSILTNVFENQCIYKLTNDEKDYKRITEYISLPQYRLQINQNKRIHRGIMHFTWMQLSSFDYCNRNEIQSKTINEFNTIMNEVEEDGDTKFIIFHCVILTDNCLLLAGYPSWNIMKWRQDMRERLTSHPCFHEPHLQNIVHSTIVRFTDKIDLPVIHTAMKDIQALLPLKFVITNKLLRRCSLKMGPEIQRF